MEEGFRIVSEDGDDLNDDNVPEFLNYLEKTWLSEATFSVFGHIRRTNNALESSHSTLGEVGKGPALSIFCGKYRSMLFFLSYSLIVFFRQAFTQFQHFFFPPLFFRNYCRSFPRGNPKTCPNRLAGYFIRRGRQSNRDGILLRLREDEVTGEVRQGFSESLGVF